MSHAMGAVFTPEQVALLKQRFFANIQNNGGIIASPSQHKPDYYYDWVRDSAISMGLIETWYESTYSELYKSYLYRYVTWTKNIQNQQDSLPGHDILGEPKFYIDGTPFAGPWGRPQNDGPAIRATVLTRFAQQLLDQQNIDYVQSHLYNQTMTPVTMGVIKTDLEYIAHHWHEINFDLWEEISGHHFFTAMVQKKALMDGAHLAKRLNDVSAAVFYENQAQLIDERLAEHIDYENQLIQATLPPHSNPQKTYELDSAVILAVLMNPQPEGPFSPQHELVKNTVKNLHQQFNEMFPINKNARGAILFGRYPGDTYDGYHTTGKGNPWFILTATMAEYYFTLADNLSNTLENQSQINKYLTKGDSYLKLIKKYAPEMYLSEQINLNTGNQQGAYSLTWSYVSVLRALDLREKVQKKITATIS